ncbi:hypothetical protein [Deinococcus ruber]|uniref:Uncharacterized protein n=1 Tax=Deinococcus ruber TaxID=1848197 RepID=A0A918CLX1_9DEIO|nr:hypothetical protein [Deinococcus ruber]GGR31151.1 hypothetical protein GCM10008957_47240 [Deinococcus ruber]
MTEPRITRFIINRTSRTVSYTVEGYGHLVKGAAPPGTTPLRLMLQFLADYAPADLDTVPKCLAEVQAYSEHVLEWETDETGLVFENGPVIRVPVASFEVDQRAALISAEQEQQRKLERLKQSIGYGKYAALKGMLK